MPLRLGKKNVSNQETQNENAYGTYQSGAKQIQRMIKPKTHLWLEKSCVCTICQEQKPLINKNQHPRLQFKESSNNSHEWLKKILSGLTDKFTKGLKLFIPDVLFVLGEGLEIFSTNKKDYRIMKSSGTTPIKSLVNTMTRLRKEYKSMLEESYKKTLIDKLDPKSIHVKYFDKLLPSHFHDGDDSTTLSSNKSTFRTYILNDNSKLIIPSIEQHKMNDKQPFATIRYAQGNYQLLNQKEFEMFSIVKLPDDVVFVQSYVKAKEGDGVVMSGYSGGGGVDQRLWKRAEVYVMVLLGGLGRYDEGYDNLQNFQDEVDEIMKHNPQQCAKLLTYQIIHFLSMASKIFITHIKLKWIINDIDNLYLQQVIEFQTQQISKRPIRYKQPLATSEIQNFYSDQQYFLQVHSQLKRKKEENVGMIKKRLMEESYQDITGRRFKQSANKSKIMGENQLIMVNSENIGSSTAIMKSNYFKRVNQKRTISIIDNESFINKRASIETKDTTLLQSSRKFRTIPVKKTEFLLKNESTQSNLRQNPYKTRRSVSLFGDVITRYEQKMISRENRSVNRYEAVKNDKLKKSSFILFQTPHSRRNSLVSINLE